MITNVLRPREQLRKSPKYVMYLGLSIGMGQHARSLLNLIRRQKNKNTWFFRRVEDARDFVLCTRQTTTNPRSLQPNRAKKSSAFR